MSKRTKRVICLTLIFSMLGMFLTGCVHVEKETIETVSKLTEIPTLPSFIPEPDRTVTEVDLPESYNYLEDNTVPVLRNQGNTNTCWAFASWEAYSPKESTSNTRH